MYILLISVNILYRRVYFMVNYRKILECYFSGMTQRTIEVAVGSSRNTIRDVVKKAEEKELIELTEYGDGFRPLVRNFRPVNAE